MIAATHALVALVVVLFAPAASFTPSRPLTRSRLNTVRSSSFASRSPFSFVEDLFTSFQPKALPPLPEKAQLLALIEELEAKGGSRGSASPLAQGLELQRLLDALALANPNPQCVSSPAQRAALVGVWRLVYTARANLGAEGAEWAQYLLANGPSPVQRAVIGSVAQVGRVFQTLELSDDPAADGSSRFNNFIDFRDAFGGVLNLQAAVEGYTGGTQLDIRFDNAYFEFDRNPFTQQPLATPLRLPYPVPFRLLPNESRGLLDNIYVDGDLRLARGNKGTVFVLRRDDVTVLPSGE